MKLRRQRVGSQRSMAEVELALCPIVAGQGGDDSLAFRSSDGIWYMIDMTLSEVRDLQSALGSLVHNLPDLESPNAP